MHECLKLLLPCELDRTQPLLLASMQDLGLARRQTHVLSDHRSCLTGIFQGGTPCSMQALKLAISGAQDVSDFKDMGHAATFLCMQCRDGKHKYGFSTGNETLAVVAGT